jgi:hypothetical protein
MSTTRRRPLVAAFALLAALVVAIPVLTSDRAGAADSQVYVVHGIPGVAVDVYAGGALALPDFQPGATAGPLTLPQGDLPILVFGAIADPPDAASDRVDPVVIDQVVPVPSGADVSLVANIEGGTPNLQAFANDLSAVPAGSARVTVRHTADAPAVDVLVNGAVAIPGLAPGTEASAVLPAGTYDIQVQLTDGTPIAALSPGTVDIPAARNVIVYAVGSASDQDFPLGLVQQALVVPVQEAPVTPTTPATTPAPTPAPAAAAAATAAPSFTG